MYVHVSLKSRDVDAYYFNEQNTYHNNTHIMEREFVTSNADIMMMRTISKIDCKKSLTLTYRIIYALTIISIVVCASIAICA